MPTRLELVRMAAGTVIRLYQAFDSRQKIQQSTFFVSFFAVADRNELGPGKQL